MQAGGMSVRHVGKNKNTGCMQFCRAVKAIVG